MPDKMFVTVWGLQKAEIEAHCFGSCKKVIFGLLMDEQLGGLSHCFEANCPFVEKEMPEPFGEVDGTNAYLRKLTAAEQAQAPDAAPPSEADAPAEDGASEIIGGVKHSWKASMLNKIWFFQCGFLVNSVLSRIDRQDYSTIVYPLSILVLWLILGCSFLAQRRLTKRAPDAAPRGD